MGKQKEEEESWRGWSDQPPELVEKIISSLFTVDRIQLASVCRRWRAISRSLPLPDSTCLLSFLDDGSYSLRDPMNGNRMISCSAPDLFDVTILCSGHDWLLCCQMMQDRTFFFNPLSRIAIDISQPLHGDTCYGYGFSAPPTSPDCIAFTSTYIIGYLWRRGDKYWTEIKTNDTFKFPVANPIFLNGSFYCLDDQINLGVFQPNDDEDGIFDKGNNYDDDDDDDDEVVVEEEEDEARALGCNFRLLETPEWIKSRNNFNFDGNNHPSRPFLIESNGELFIVVLDDVKETITVYGVDPDKRRWTLVDDLGDRIFFVGALSCISAEGTAVVKSRIYLQRIQQQACAYYSMDSRRMHLTDDKEVHGHDPQSWKRVWYRTLHYPTSVWIKSQWYQ